METLAKLAEKDEISQEYEKAYWLKIFRSIVQKMDSNIHYKNRIMQLFRESYNHAETVTNIIQKEFDQNISMEYADMMEQWLVAHIKKKSSREAIPFSIKKDLYEKQNHECAICKKTLKEEWAKIHVDHIIPWELVGDELDDNFQDLCETCNEEKSSNTNYVFMKLIGLR